jgi:hypothetical protein
VNFHYPFGIDVERIEIVFNIKAKVIFYRFSVRDVLKRVTSGD